MKYRGWEFLVKWLRREDERHSYGVLGTKLESWMAVYDCRAHV